MSEQQQDQTKTRPLKVVLWGTFDTTKPRNRILLDSLSGRDVEVIQVHRDIWSGVKDKSQIDGVGAKMRLGLRWAASYPGLIYRYLKAPKHDVIFVGYLGLFDVLVLKPFALLRGKKIVWDMFICLYDTVVMDRKLVSVHNPLAWLLYVLEWLTTRSATTVLMDTKSHADRVRALFNLDKNRMGTVYLGVEADHFPREKPSPRASSDTPHRILFYGQFIPLHGIGTIIEAAHMLRDEPIEWILVGEGQDASAVQARIKDLPGQMRLSWKPWVSYGALKDEIAAADICLGIFGSSEKAACVIPNKVYQILSVGRPLITRRSPAILELIKEDEPGVKLVAPDAAGDLCTAIRELIHEGLPLPRESILSPMSPDVIAESFTSALKEASR